MEEKSQYFQKIAQLQEKVPDQINQLMKSNNMLAEKFKQVSDLNLHLK